MIKKDLASADNNNKKKLILDSVWQKATKSKGNKVYKEWPWKMSGFVFVFRKKVVYNTSICLVERRKNRTEVARGILENLELCDLLWQLEHKNSKHVWFQRTMKSFCRQITRSPTKILSFFFHSKILPIYEYF